MKRVVITGLGMVSPLGADFETTWKNILAGESGAGPITQFDASDLSTRIAFEVKRGDGTNGTLNMDQWVDGKDQRRFDDFIQFALVAAKQAMTDAGLEIKNDDQAYRSGVMVGSGIGGLTSIYETSLLLQEKGPRRISPFFIPGSLINLASGLISINLGLKGPNSAVVTACSTGSHAIGDAARIIMMDDADVMVAGGAEACINRLGIAGFIACKALSHNFNDDPKKASRPYDKDRDGFVMGEGAGIVVLESLEHAKARGAKIYAEVIGYGMSGDAYHVTAPSEDGDGAYRCMQAALRRAQIDARDIDYVNAHGTSTPLGDEIELKAVERLLGNSAPNLSMSSTKSAVGHLLGAAGAVEAIFSVLALRDNICPPTLNLDNPSVQTSIDLVPKQAKKKEINTVLSNSFGFGGTNASLIMRRYAA
ncbi:beta-ketoacyl-ACP synthase II [Aestuariivirga litoralis]|uniref:beta-ketoacyl-ACP synthase II n=1 Tax=Aestuariivirga litoralis TaxID=2650924 RepID=UPI0018C4D65D|nr:beta-ketoacyl-ACP synthase II [Aestuariivirga litoralis]MBG1232034.1 beta-ketoacyl-ACP synthase II [Aestuariivirga litoralis]